MARRLLMLGLALAALVAVYAAAWQTQPRQATATPAPVSQAGATASVTSVTRTCPPPGPGTGVGHVAVVAVPAAAGGASQATGTGSAQLSAIPQAASQPASKAGTKAVTKTSAKTSGKSAATPAPVTVTRPGAPALPTAPQATSYGGTAISATGQMAEGFEAEMATSSGIGLVSCTHPGADMWFVGTGTSAGASTSELYLANTGNLAATVDVTLITDSGVQQGLSSAITVAPDGYQAVNLATYAHGSVVMAVHVQTSSGQVAAAVWQSGGSGGGWLPQATEPSTQLVIPGLASASSAAHLFVVVPGAADAHIKVKALTSHGPFLPFGTGAEDAPAAASSSFALTSLGATAASLVLTSDVPITAGISVPGSGIGEFSAAAAPITQQGVVAGNPAAGQGTVSLILSAPAGAAAASIAVLPAAAGSTGTGTSAGASAGTVAGHASPQVVRVPAGDTVTVAVQPPKGSAPFAIAVTPQQKSGPLYAARVVTSGGSTGPVVSILPVPSAPTEIALPPSRDSYTAILP
ncbi:MAG TPA: DUF5719 family protein [Trebonia sp.]|nr:DUF5719 family protein [Trebonia sp.]